MFVIVTPMFLFLHVYDVHYNYDAPAPYNERFDRSPAIEDISTCGPGGTLRPLTGPVGSGAE